MVEQRHPDLDPALPGPRHRAPEQDGLDEGPGRGHDLHRPPGAGRRGHVRLETGLLPRERAGEADRDAEVRCPLVDVRADGGAAQLERLAGRNRSGEPQLRALDDEVDGLEVVGCGERSHGRLVLRRDLRERVAGPNDVADGRPRRPRQDRCSSTGPECGQRRRAGDPVDCQAPGALEADEPRFRRGAEVSVDVEQPKMARAREQELH